MLEYAIPHKEEIVKLRYRLFSEPRYKYAGYEYEDFEFNCSDEQWHSLHMVSVVDGKVIGYFRARINRASRYVESLLVINFYEKNKIEFGKDLKKFMEMLFSRFYKVKFSVIVGNPVEKTYDRLIKKYNGRVVGVYEKDILLFTGELCDQKKYEIFSENYWKAKEKAKR